MRRGKRVMENLDQDIRDHIERETQDNIERGMPPEEARYAALRKFGNVTLVKEETREVWSYHWLEHLWQDVRYGLRMLRKNPGFAAVAVITLALGIGANTAIFSVVDGVLLQPLSYAAPERLVSAAQFSIPRGFFVAVRDRSRTMEMAGYSYDAGVNLSRQGEAVRLLRSKVSVGLFPLLGVNAALGRVFRKDEGQDEVVILSHALWERKFGSDPGIVGRWIRLDDVDRQVVGVMPASFSLP
jgi:MacB-like periplasmic core domain